ncbi:type II toxin-antitoxin system HicB family antitoxin [bacterium]|nr:type II toxin-antitoxin system HicB family antitoxin [bacterium]
MRAQTTQLIHKGYSGTVNFSAEDGVFWGKIEGIKATVSYEGHDAKSLLASFREAVEDYLDMCEHEGIEPEKPYKGTFNVRMPSELHRELAFYAKKEDLNLNSAVRAAVEYFLRNKGHVSG